MTLSTPGEKIVINVHKPLTLSLSFIVSCFNLGLNLESKVELAVELGILWLQSEFAYQ